VRAHALDLVTYLSFYALWTHAGPPIHTLHTVVLDIDSNEATIYAGVPTYKNEVLRLHI